MTKTIFGGMDSDWAAKMNLPAQRSSILLVSNTGLKQLSKDRLNVVNFVRDRSRLETDLKRWQKDFAAALALCKGYQVEAVIENEPCMLSGYTAKRYCDLLSVSANVADSFGVRIWHGALVMPQAVRMYGESLAADKDAYRSFRALCVSYGIWGKTSRARDGEDEIKWMQQYGRTIGLNYHFQHFADVLPQVNAYLLSKGLKLMDNELSWRGGDPATIEKLIAAENGNNEITIWDNIKGVQGDIIPLDGNGENVLLRAVS